MSYELKFDRIRAIADEVLAEKGEDFVYNINPELNVCMYVPLSTNCDTDNDDPRLTTGCLVGEILKRAGVNVDKLGMGSICSVYVDRRVRVWQTDEPVRIDDVTLEWLHVAQGVQDRGGSWGQAVAEADSALAQAADDEE